MRRNLFKINEMAFGFDTYARATTDWFLPHYVMMYNWECLHRNGPLFLRTHIWIEFTSASNGFSEPHICYAHKLSLENLNVRNVYGTSYLGTDRQQSTFGFANLSITFGVWTSVSQTFWGFFSVSRPDRNNYVRCCISAITITRHRVVFCFIPSAKQASYTNYKFISFVEHGVGKLDIWEWNRPENATTWRIFGEIEKLAKARASGSYACPQARMYRKLIDSFTIFIYYYFHLDSSP